MSLLNRISAAIASFRNRAVIGHAPAHPPLMVPTANASSLVPATPSAVGALPAVPLERAAAETSPEVHVVPRAVAEARSIGAAVESSERLKRVTPAQALGMTETAFRSAALEHAVKQVLIKDAAAKRSLPASVYALSADALVPAPLTTPATPASRAAVAATQTNDYTPTDSDGTPQPNDGAKNPAALLKIALENIQEALDLLSPDQVPDDPDDDVAQARAALAAGDTTKALAHATKRLGVVTAAVKNQSALRASAKSITAEQAQTLRDQVVTALSVDAARAQARTRLFARIQPNASAPVDRGAGLSTARFAVPANASQSEINSTFKAELARLDREIDAAAREGLIPQALLSRRRQVNQEWTAALRKV